MYYHLFVVVVLGSNTTQYFSNKSYFSLTGCHHVLGALAPSMLYAYTKSDTLSSKVAVFIPYCQPDVIPLEHTFCRHPTAIRHNCP